MNRDILHYFFFAYDWKYNKDKTTVLLAVDNSSVERMMLVYDERIVQLRGNSQAVEALFGRLDLEEVELQSLKEHKVLVLEKYTPTDSCEFMLMELRKGYEKPQIRHTIAKLDVSDAEQIAAIMRDSAEFWAEVTSQRITQGMVDKTRNWIGVKANG